MGSNSTNISSTAYTNTPQTVSENALALANSNLVTGQGNFSGSQNNTKTFSGSTTITSTSLDGGAIASAFGFGAEVIKGLFQSQKESNALISNTNSAANGLISRSQELVDKKENLPANTLNAGSKTVWILAAVFGVYLIYKARK